MVSLEPDHATTSVPCLRTYGRAEMALRGYIESPLGRSPCHVRDLSLGGAGIETEQKLAPDQSIWLTLSKLKIFGTVKWVRGNLLGIQFEEKLPKSVVLSLRGEVVDPEALAEIEAMLAAQNWVIGTPIDRPKSVRLADVLGLGSGRIDKSFTEGAKASGNGSVNKTSTHLSGKRRAAAIIAMSAAFGLLMGLGSIFFF